MTRNGRDFEYRGGVTLPEEWRQFDEERAVELSDGRWWALIRTKTGLCKSYSSDDGKPWEGGLLLDGRTGVAYPDGDIAKDGMITVVYDHNRTKEKEILMARFTEEDARRGENVLRRVLLRQRVR